MIKFRILLLSPALLLTACCTGTYVDILNHSGGRITAYSSHSGKTVAIKEGRSRSLPHSDGMINITTDDGRSTRFNISWAERSTPRGIILSFRVEIDRALKRHKQSTRPFYLHSGRQKN